MRNIINMIIKIAIIAGAAWLFPEYVQVQDTKTLIQIAIVTIVASVILAVLMLAIFALTAIMGAGCLGIILTIAIALASGIITLMAAVYFVPGFEIRGTVTYIVLAILIAVFSLEEGGQ